MFHRLPLSFLLIALSAIRAMATVPAADSAAALPGARSLRSAIEDLRATFPDRYPRGKEFLHRLDALQGQARPAGRRRPRLAALRREALLANPLLCGQPILFVVRKQYRARPPQHGDDVPDRRDQHRRASRGAGR